MVTKKKTKLKVVDKKTKPQSRVTIPMSSVSWFIQTEGEVSIVTNDGYQHHLAGSQVALFMDAYSKFQSGKMITRIDVEYVL